MKKTFLLATLCTAFLSLGPKLALADADNSDFRNNDEVSTSLDHEFDSEVDFDRARPRFRWVRVGDFAPAMCAGTPQAGDGNPHIVWSPLEVGLRCTRWNVGQRYCDAGFDGRYLDRHWVCRRVRF